MPICTTLTIGLIDDGALPEQWSLGILLTRVVVLTKKSKELLVC